MPKKWPQGSWTGRLLTTVVVVALGRQGVLLVVKGSWQMAQRRWEGGICLGLMGGTERRKSKVAVVVLRSVVVVGERGIVVIVCDGEGGKEQRVGGWGNQ